MTLNDNKTLLLHSEDLELVGNYDPGIPLIRLIANGSLRTGQLYLRLTLDEMIKIRSLSKSANENHHILLRETRAQYDYLVRRNDQLENFLDTRSWMVKFFQRKAVKRSIQAFIADSVDLYESTKAKSDKLKREVLSFHTIDCPRAEGGSVGKDGQSKVKSDELKTEVLSIRTMDCTLTESESVGKDEQIKGVSVDLGGPVTQEAIAIIRDAASFLMSAHSFADTASSESQDGGTSPSETVTLSSTRSSVSTLPSSLGSASGLVVNFQVNCNVVNNKDTNCTGLTIVNGSSGSSGLCVIGADSGSLTSVNSTSS